MTKTTKNILSKIQERKPKNLNVAEDSPSKTSPKTGLPPGWTRATVILREEHKEKLEAIAFMSNIPLKDVIDRILTNFFSDKDIQPIPKMGKDQIMKLFDKKKA